jgi:hypothetical protein
MIRKRKRDKLPRFGKGNHHAGVVQSEISEASSKASEIFCAFFLEVSEIFPIFAASLVLA